MKEKGSSSSDQFPAQREEMDSEEFSGEFKPYVPPSDEEIERQLDEEWSEEKRRAYVDMELEMLASYKDEQPLLVEIEDYRHEIMTAAEAREIIRSIKTQRDHYRKSINVISDMPDVYYANIESYKRRKLKELEHYPAGQRLVVHQKKYEPYETTIEDLRRYYETLDSSVRYEAELVVVSEDPDSFNPEEYHRLAAAAMKGIIRAAIDTARSWHHTKMGWLEALDLMDDTRKITVALGDQETVMTVSRAKALVVSLPSGQVNDFSLRSGSSS